MHNEEKALHEPLIRISRRASISPCKAWLIRGIAFILALLTGALLIAVLGHDPIKAQHCERRYRWGCWSGEVRCRP